MQDDVGFSESFFDKLSFVLKSASQWYGHIFIFIAAQ